MGVLVVHFTFSKKQQRIKIEGFTGAGNHRETLGQIVFSIRPIIKNELFDPRDSSNYSPTTIAPCASKLAEKLKMERLVTFLETCDKQFGFKKHHSTDMCIYSLKDTIIYYRSLKAPSLACFIEIKSAYDRISQGRLFCKVTLRGFPAYIVNFLSFWYMRQRIFVKEVVKNLVTFMCLKKFARSKFLLKFFEDICG